MDGTILMKNFKGFFIVGFICLMGSLLPANLWAQDSNSISAENNSSPRLSTWFRGTLQALHLSPSPLKEAQKAYANGDYDLAVQKFSEAELDHPNSQALAYNTGNALFKKKQYDLAIPAFKKALNGTDTKVAAAAYYNLGNAHFRKGEFAIQSGKQEGLQDYREAMANYKKSLEIIPQNIDAKRNVEVVQARIKELLDRQKQDQKDQQKNNQPPPEPSEKAKAVLARAMQLVEQRKYAEAKNILEQIIQEDPTAASYKSHVQRIDDVEKILRGEIPTAPKSQDPRAQQNGVGVI